VTVELERQVTVKSFSRGNTSLVGWHRLPGPRHLNCAKTALQPKTLQLNAKVLRKAISVSRYFTLAHPCPSHLPVENHSAQAASDSSSRDLRHQFVARHCVTFVAQPLRVKRVIICAFASHCMKRTVKIELPGTGPKPLATRSRPGEASPLPGSGHLKVHAAMTLMIHPSSAIQ
jgi:hypothetical protein